jgi:hypothetical protein
MNHYTQLNLNGKKPSDSVKKESTPLKGSPSRMMMFGGITLIAACSAGVLLISNGCSKAKQIASQPQPAPVSTPPVTSVPASTAVSNRTPVVAKVTKKKRPALVTFHDTNYGISFQYPRKYSLKSGEAATELADLGSTTFVQPGGVPVARVEFPKEAYAGTDLEKAFFDVSVHPSLSAPDCEQFASAEAAKPGMAPPAKVMVGKTEFDQFENIASDNSEIRYYHLFDRGVCYEFALGLGVRNIASENDIAPVDRQSVFGRLEKILASVKIEPAGEDEVAAGTTQQPSGEHQ